MCTREIQIGNSGCYFFRGSGGLMTDERENGSIGLIESRPARSQLYPWYDSGWLMEYARAKAIIEEVKPEALTEFVNAFRILHTRPDFQARLFDRIFDDDTFEEIRRVTASLRPKNLELHEVCMFGRFVVHGHPFFTELQRRTVPLVSEAVGEPVEMTYNFLSLYGARGVCPLHMDAPKAKWTLDLCIDQSAPWPIYFSQVNPWPQSEAETEEWADEDWENKVKQSPSLHFRPYALQPGQAVAFSGSSQWHYREPIPEAGGRTFCNLLFFHFTPSGTSKLVEPRNWARLFGIPELRHKVSWAERIRRRINRRRAYKP
jgi:hypothetical protein